MFRAIINIAVLLLASYGFAFAGAKLITIQVDSPPDIDPDIYKRIAVLPFSSNDETFHAGIILAREITEAVDDKDIYLVESRDIVFRLADDIDYEPTSRDDAIEMGNKLGVDAIIYGKVKLYTETYSPEGYGRNELYTVDKKYAPPVEYGNTYLKDYYDIDVRFKFEVVLKVLDVNTERLLRRRELEKTYSETYDSGDIPLDEDTMDEIVKGLAEELAEDYVYTLDSHKVEEKRYMVSF
ncbi:MAG: hypothetical protein GY771_02325 [bacterium]|nr:hypothetical protein [bacterium]